MNKYKIIISIIIVLIMFFLTIGYSSLNSEMIIKDINLSVKLKKDIRITSVSISNSNKVTMNDINYNVSNITSSVKFEDKESFITYKVTITNYGNTEMSISNIYGLQDDLEYSIDEYNIKDKICNRDNNCTLGINKDIYITVRDNNPNNSIKNIELNFEFKRIYNIYYEDIIIFNYPTTAIENDDIKIILINEIPNNIEIIGNNTYLFNNNEITIYNIENDITIKRKEKTEIASFNIRSVYRQLHDGIFSDGTRYKNGIEYLKRADTIPIWMENTNWWSLGTKTKVVDEYQWIYGNNGIDGGTLPIVFWIDIKEKTLYWYSEDISPKVTITEQYGMTSFFDSFYSAIDLSGASNWDVSEITYFDGLCNGCSKIKNLNFLKNWDVSNAKTMKYAFKNMTSLEDASGINNWNINNVEDFTEMFNNTPIKPIFTKKEGTFNQNGTYIPN